LSKHFGVAGYILLLIIAAVIAVVMPMAVCGHVSQWQIGDRDEADTTKRSTFSCWLLLY